MSGARDRNELGETLNDAEDRRLEGVQLSTPARFTAAVWRVGATSDDSFVTFVTGTVRG